MCLHIIPIRNIYCNAGKTANRTDTAFQTTHNLPTYTIGAVCKINGKIVIIIDKHTQQHPLRLDDRSIGLKVNRLRILNPYRIAIKTH